MIHLLCNNIIGQYSHRQGCVSSFSKELSSQLQILGHLELLFSLSSFQGLHGLKFSSNTKVFKFELSSGAVPKIERGMERTVHPELSSAPGHRFNLVSYHF